MKLQATFLLSAMLSANVFAAGTPPSGVFTCNGESTIHIKGNSSRYIFEPYSSTIIFKPGKKYTLTSATPSYTSRGTYWWADNNTVMLHPAARTEAYRKLALGTCKVVGWKCTATTYIGFNVGVDIIDDSNLKLGLLNVTKINAITNQGPTKLEMWTSSQASCVKN